MPDHEDQPVCQLADLPIGYEPLCETGTDRGEALRLCQRLRDAGKETLVTDDGGWHIVWRPVLHPWPLR